MAYRDKDKQREANRRASQRRRDKRKGMMKQGVTTEGMTQGMTGSCCVDYAPNFTGEIPKPKRGKDIKCFEDLHPDIQANIREISESDEEFKRRTAVAISYQHSHANRYYPKDAVLNYVVIGKPGDDDYNGICTPEWIAGKIG